MLFLSLLCLLGISRCLANTVEISLGSQIKHALIYSSHHAEILQLAEIHEELPSNDDHTVVISGLPSSLVDNSLRLQAPKDFEILDFKIEVNKIPRDRTPEYTSALKGLEKEELTKIQAEQDLMHQQARKDLHIDYLKKVLDSSLTIPSGDKEKVNKPFEPNELFKLIENVSKQLEVLYQERVEIITKLDRVKYELTEVRKKLNKLKFPNNNGIIPDKEEKVVRVHVFLKGKGNVVKDWQLQLQYLCQPASWEPQYDLYLIKKPADSAAAAATTTEHNSVSPAEARSKYVLQVDYFASVWQSTGADWTGVNLTLSTSSPAYISDLPTPQNRHQYQPQRYYSTESGMQQKGRAAPRAHHARMSKRGDVEMSFAGENVMVAESASMMMMDAMEPVAASSVASSGSLQSAFVFNLNHLVNITDKSRGSRLMNELQASRILPDGTGVSFSDVDSDIAKIPVNYKHLILVDRKYLPVSVFSYAVPSMESQAFLTAWGRYPLAATPLLPSSNVRVEVEGSLTGTSSFPGARAGEQLKLNLGPDPNIKISYENVEPRQKGMVEDKSTWFVTDKKKYRVVTKEKLIKVQNLRMSGQEFAMVMIAERIPRSEDEEIKVELLSPLDSQLEVASKHEQLSKALTTEDFMAGVVHVERENMNKGAAKIVADVGLNEWIGKEGKVRYYRCPTSNNLYWVLWVRPGDTRSLSFKYKITAPEDKGIPEMY